MNDQILEPLQFFIMTFNLKKYLAYPHQDVNKKMSLKIMDIKYLFSFFLNRDVYGYTK